MEFVWMNAEAKCVVSFVDDLRNSGAQRDGFPVLREWKVIWFPA